MARIFRVLTVAVASLLVIGCSSLLENACTNGFTSPSHPECRPIVAQRNCTSINWEDYGFRLGKRGDSSLADENVTECRAYPGTIDEAKLVEGLKRGLELFCADGRSFDIGFHGGKFEEKAVCTKEQNEKARLGHEKGDKSYCEPKSGYKVGYQDREPRKNCGSAWTKQFKLGKTAAARHREQARIVNLKVREENLREEYYRLERKRIDLTERKLRLPRIGEGESDQRQKIELEILDVDREILRVKQEQEQLTTEIAKVKSETSTQ